MARDLPYFKFFVSEWNDGDITLEDFETQGLFINLCSYYWSNECDLSLEKAKKKFKTCPERVFDELINSGILKVQDGFIVINFLDEQKEERLKKSKVNSENGQKGGRPKKQNKTEEKPNAFNSESEQKAKQKAIREDKRREEEKREEKNISRPSLEEVQKFFEENNYMKQVATKAFNFYNDNEWKDSKGNEVKNWKNKMRQIWFKKENESLSHPNRFKLPM